VPRALRAAGARPWLRALTRPVREAAFLARTFAASWTRPTWAELTGGVLSKAPGFVLGLGWWAAALLPSSPAAFTCAAALTLALNAFHGVWIDTWSNFQNQLGKTRGLHYQAAFNLLYMQLMGAAFRFIAWTAVPGTVPPWSHRYWLDMGVATLAGTFFGTLGFQGVNGLYDKGRIPRWGRSLIQQFRDVFFTLGGAFFGTGSMAHFWTLFVVQQAFDLGLYRLSRRAARRPILYVTPAHLASTGEFRSLYPVEPGPEVSPLAAAGRALFAWVPNRSRKP